MRWRDGGYLLMAVLLSGAAWAQSLSLTLGVDRIAGGGALSGPLVGLPTPTGAYSFRKLVTGYAGSAIRFRRASDSTQQDIGFTAVGDFDITAMTTFCNATTCFVAKWYDQSGNGLDFAQATVGNQPALQLSCIGVVPCPIYNSSVPILNAASTSQTAGVVSFNAVLKRTVGTGPCNTISVGTNALKPRNGIAGLAVGNGASVVSDSSAENTWHSSTGVINGSGTYLATDGATVTGNVTGSTTSSTPTITGTASTTCYTNELVFWEGYALTAPQAAALNTNQHAYWGF